MNFNEDHESSLNVHLDPGGLIADKDTFPDKWIDMLDAILLLIQIYQYHDGSVMIFLFF